MSSESTLGAYLRRRRERAGLSVEAVSAGSRIVPELVRALEADRHDILPAPVYVRGFIRAYCEQVGASAEEPLRRYDAHVALAPAIAARSASPPPVRPSPAAHRWRRAVAGAILLAGLGVAVTLLLGRARQPDAVAGRGGSPPLTAPRPAVPAAPAPPPTSVTPAPPGPPATSPTAAAPGAPVPVERLLVMRAVDTTWVRVKPDGAPPTEETLSPGAVRVWRSTGRFRVSLGNASGVELELDGRALPALGERGQVIRDATIPNDPRP
jgi:hypothetical protein